MARWFEFEAAAPGLAAVARERFEASGVVMLGTLRRDGSPRISPVEFAFFDGDFWIGMMWQSRKARDLLRDPRFAVHSSVVSKAGDTGDVKLYGAAVDEPDPARRAAFTDHVFATSGFRPEEPYHAFVLDVREASYVRFGDDAAAVMAGRLAGGTTRVREVQTRDGSFLLGSWKREAES